MREGAGSGMQPDEPERGTSRRSFLTRLLRGTIAAGAAAVAGAIAAYLSPSAEVRSALGPQRVKVGRADEIAPGTGKLALVDDEPVWVLNVGRGFVGLSATCTHKGCVVKWEEGRRLFRCPCHDGRFDDHGNVVAGLPRRPLSRFDVAVVGGDVYVSRSDVRHA